MLALVIISAHLLGDFWFQNHWMQQKAQSSFVCSIHVACYALPWLVVMAFVPLQPWQLAAILIQHWIQDRFSLHMKWMRFYKQTPPDKWANGPLCMDQTLHIAWIALIINL